MSFITTLNGKRCTAIPRSSSLAAATISVQSTTTPAAAVQPSAPIPVAVPAPAPAAVEPPNITTSSTKAAPSSVVESSQTTQVVPPPPATSSSTTVQSAPAQITSSDTSGESSSTTDVSPVTATEGSISTSSTSPSSFQTSISAPPPIAQSELSASTSTPIDIGALAPTSTSPTSPQLSVVSISPTTGDTVSSSGTSKAGPVAGGVIGGIMLFALISFLLWWFRRRRRRRESFLTPLNSPPFPEKAQFYEIDDSSIGPTRFVNQFKERFGYYSKRMGTGLSDFGVAVKEKLPRSRSTTPSVNLNRGNSQFLESIPQHSRTSSTVTGSSGRLTVRDRFGDWWQRLTADALFNWRLKRGIKETNDPFAAARERRAVSQANNVPDFSNFLAMKDDELRTAADHRRASFASRGSLSGFNVDFSTAPFDTNLSGANPTIPDLSGSAQARVVTFNPFADPQPIKPPPPAAAPNHYLPTISERSSESRSRSPSVGATSRYPSTIRTSQDSYRSTLMSSLSELRNKKGRSDPFDLALPDIWIPPIPDKRQSGAGTTSLARADTRNGKPRKSKPMQKNAPASPPPHGPTSNLLDSLAAFKDERRSIKKSNMLTPSNLTSAMPQPMPTLLSEISTSQSTSETKHDRSIPSSSSGTNVGNNLSLNSNKESTPSAMTSTQQLLSNDKYKPRQVSVQQLRISDAGSYSSKYSSGLSAFQGQSQWGDPGPDLGQKAQWLNSNDYGPVSPVSPIGNLPDRPWDRGVGSAR